MKSMRPFWNAAAMHGHCGTMSIEAWPSAGIAWGGYGDADGGNALIDGPFPGVVITASGGVMDWFSSSEYVWSACGAAAGQGGELGWEDVE